MNDIEDDPHWQAAEQHTDECWRREAVMEALRTAKAKGVPDEALMTLAYECGVASDFYREIRIT